MIICRLNLKMTGCSNLSTRLKGKQSLDVPTQGHQTPLAFDILESSQQTLPISHHRFDDAKHRFGCLFAQGVQLSALWRLQPMRHLLQRTRRAGRGFGSCGKALFPAYMMRCAPRCDQRLDLRRRALLDVALTEVAAVGQYPFGATELLGQLLQLLDHRQELSFVVDRLRDIGGYDEHAARSDHRLGVVTL